MFFKKIYIKASNKFSDFQSKAAIRFSDTNHQIYHIHIRKSAGTSINFSFLNHANPSNPKSFYEKLAKSDQRRLLSKGRVYVGWNVNLINQGNYHYAFSHTPIHQLSIPKHIKLITCLRDPVNRVVSHYNMILYYKLYNVKHPCMKREGSWLGEHNSLEEFVLNMPRSALENQLYMFSRDYSVKEAAQRILSLYEVLFTERLADNLACLQEKLGLLLPISNQKKYDFPERHHILPRQRKEMEELLASEYELIRIVKENIERSKNV